MSAIEEGLRRFQADLDREVEGGARPARRLGARLTDARNLRAALDRVLKAPGARTPGTDGVTGLDLARSADPWLAELRRDMERGAYRPSLVRWVHIPKPGEAGAGPGRRIGILTLRDRVVQAALKQLLEPVLEPRFAPCSFGFRPGRSVGAALWNAVGLLSGAYSATGSAAVAVRADIADCFANVDLSILERALAGPVEDDSFVRLLFDLLGAWAESRGWPWNRRLCGLVQGSPLSPLLCNFYLTPVDCALEKLAVETGGDLRALRYADDFLLVASGRRRTSAGPTALRKAVAELSLRLREGKLKVFVVDGGVEWLGVSLRRRAGLGSGRGRFGYFVPEAKVLDLLRRVGELTAAPGLRPEQLTLRPERWLDGLNEQLLAWRQAYGRADNAAEVFRELDAAAAEGVAKLLGRSTGRPASQVEAEQWVRLPRGFGTWRVGDTRLVVLSSLATRGQEVPVRPPSWRRVASAVENQAAAAAAPGEWTVWPGAGGSKSAN
ncbi:MAG: hypothetical protein HYZ53_30265 [Planctomycetes bacterium]|nr:hypothetical protein [Planctomycetota bacterium]